MKWRGRTGDGESAPASFGRRGARWNPVDTTWDQTRPRKPPFRTDRTANRQR